MSKKPDQERIFELQNQFSKDSQIKMYFEIIESIVLLSNFTIVSKDGIIKLEFDDNVQFRIDFFAGEIYKIKKEKYSELFFNL